MHSDLREIGIVEATHAQQARWRSGTLAQEWARRFPELFDADDVRLAESQGQLGYHFYEWLGAVMLHHLTGYLALVGKYEFKTHPRKQRIVEQLLSPNALETLRDRTTHGNTQGPDLLMYAPDMSDWFFCEMKGPGDRLSTKQKGRFRELAEVSGRPVRVLRVKWAPDRPDVAAA